MSATKIEWVRNADGTQGTTWNPVRGCSRMSRGCENCYAERMSARFSAGGVYPVGGICTPYKKREPFFGFAVRTPSGPRWTGRVELIASKLEEPLHWRKPRTILVNSMSDLFHKALPLAEKEKVFRVMLSANQHIYQILTKRAALMAEQVPIIMNRIFGPHWRMPAYIWLGVSVEDQATADERIPLLLQTPAAVRFVSMEPLLSAVDLRLYVFPRNAEHRGRPFVNSLDGVIAGGESGPGARPCNVEWIRSAVWQCREAGVSMFVKQLGAHPVGSCPRCLGRGTVDSWQDGMPGQEECPKYCYGSKIIPIKLHDRKGGDPSEWPEDLRVRELPEGRA